MDTYKNKIHKWQPSETYGPEYSEYLAMAIKTLNSSSGISPINELLLESPYVRLISCRFWICMVSCCTKESIHAHNLFMISKGCFSYQCYEHCKNCSATVTLLIDLVLHILQCDFSDHWSKFFVNWPLAIWKFLNSYSSKWPQICCFCNNVKLEYIDNLLENYC